MGWEDLAKLIHYFHLVLINCSDNHPDALVDSVQAYDADRGRHGGGEGLDASLPASLIEEGDKGRPSQRRVYCARGEGMAKQRWISSPAIWLPFLLELNHAGTQAVSHCPWAPASFSKMS